jgi:hypothetical protein
MNPRAELPEFCNAPLTRQITVGLGCLSGFVVRLLLDAAFLAAHRVDQESLAKEKGAIAHAFEARTGTLVRQQEFLAEWDEAIDRAYRRDTAWLAENLGSWPDRSFGFEWSIVLDGDDSVVMSYRDGAVVRVSGPAYCAEQDRRSARKTRRADYSARRRAIRFPGRCDRYERHAGNHQRSSHLEEFQSAPDCKYWRSPPSGDYFFGGAEPYGNFSPRKRARSQTDAGTSNARSHTGIGLNIARESSNSVGEPSPPRAKSAKGRHSRSAFRSSNKKPKNKQHSREKT